VSVRRQEAIVKAGTRWAERDRRVRALLLKRSLARGAANERSDVDFVVVAQPGRLSELWAERRSIAEGIGRWLGGFDEVAWQAPHTFIGLCDGPVKVDFGSRGRVPSPIPGCATGSARSTTPMASRIGCEKGSRSNRHPWTSRTSMPMPGTGSGRCTSAAATGAGVARLRGARQSTLSAGATPASISSRIRPRPEAVATAYAFRRPPPGSIRSTISTCPRSTVRALGALNPSQAVSLGVVRLVCSAAIRREGGASALPGIAHGDTPRSSRGQLEAGAGRRPGTRPRPGRRQS
jgi:hypothetical protein